MERWSWFTTDIRPWNEGELRCQHRLPSPREQAKASARPPPCALHAISLRLVLVARNRANLEQTATAVRTGGAELPYEAVIGHLTVAEGLGLLFQGVPARSL